MTNFSEKALPKYVAYSLQTDKSHEYMTGIAAGSAQPKMGIYKIEQIPITLPSLATQKEIVKKLSTYDTLIENNQKQIKLLEEAAQRLYKEWFVNLHFPGYEYATIKDGIPEGWNKGYLRDLICINYGKDHKKVPMSGSVPVYGSGGVMRKCNSFLYDGEAVLIPRKGSLNNIIYVDKKFWTVDTMFYATAKIENIMTFVYSYLHNIDMYSMNIGSAVPSMTVKVLEEMNIIIPNGDLLEKFDRQAKAYFKREEFLNRQTETLIDGRKMLAEKFYNESGREE